jgi:hypothetical protein
MGEHVFGQLIYDASGNMSAHIMRNDRPAFVAQDPFRGRDAEVRSAFEGHASYFGTYTVDPVNQTVTHHVLGASYPNWIGNDQLRYYKFDHTRLLLSTPPLVVGEQAFEFVLVWERFE